MEFCETSLIDVLRGNDKICGLYDQSSVSTLWNVAKQTQRAMQFLHSRSISHRDLKPHNILMNLGQKIQVKIADFGISRVFGPEDQDITRYSGTITYMAPELLNDEVGSIDLAGAKYADVWAFGVTLSAMVLRGDPWPKNLKKFTLVRKICEENVRPLLPADCPSEYAKLVRLCLSANPKDRPSFYSLNNLNFRYQEPQQANQYAHAPHVHLLRSHTSLHPPSRFHVPCGYVH